MKRKLLGILLALVMCLPLVVPAFAEPAEEPAAPEETATLAVEAPVPGEIETEEAEPENVPEDTAPEDAAEYFPAEGDPALSDFGAAGSIELDDVSASDEVEEFLWRMILETTGLEDWKLSDPAEIEVGTHSIAVRSDGTVWIWGDNVYGWLDQTDRDALAPASISPPVKDHPHTTVVIKTDTSYQHDATQHQLVIGLQVMCSDPDCGFTAYNIEPQPPEPHTWTQTGITYTNQGDNHQTKSYYTCNVCGATGTETTEEEHSFNKTDFGDNYHLGLRHYVEWKGYCSQCKCALTKWESYSCPGNNNGVGCVIPINKVDPPVEAEDVTEPEDVPSATDGD